MSIADHIKAQADAVARLQNAGFAAFPHEQLLLVIVMDPARHVGHSEAPARISYSPTTIRLTSVDAFIRARS